MASEDKDQEPTEEPTAKRKEEAKKQGNIARSSELNQAFVLFALIFLFPPILKFGGSSYIFGVQRALSHLPTRIDLICIEQFLSLLVPGALFILLPVILVILLVGVISNVAQVGFHVNLEKLSPSFSKLNLLNGLKRMFSRDSLFDLIKSLFKLVIFGYIGYSSYLSHWGSFTKFYQLSLIEDLNQTGEILLGIGSKIAFAWLVLAILDYAYQYQKVRKKIMMTKQELKQEMKEQEASPEIKSARASKRRKLMKARMADNVARADAIITNPTHFSVAVQYERDKMFAPMVVAKGQDFLALKIREIAKKNKVPLVENASLARALYKECEIGDIIPRDYYKAVAEVLAFVYSKTKGKKK